MDLKVINNKNFADVKYLLLNLLLTMGKCNGQNFHGKTFREFFDFQIIINSNIKNSLPIELFIITFN